MSVIISPNVQVPGSVNTPPFPLNHARIGWQSILTKDNVTADSEQTGFPAAAVVNQLTYDQWRPESLPAKLTVDYGETVDADYIGIAAHSFASDRCTVEIQYSLDAVTWVKLKDLAPGDGQPIMLLFNTITARYWRLVVDGDSPPHVGVVFIGEALAVQRAIYGGHTPIPFALDITTLSNESEGGQALGQRVIRKGVSSEYSWDYLTSAWLREEFVPFLNYARTGQWWFIAWNPLRHPNEVGYCKATKVSKPTNMGQSDFMQVNMSVKGHISD